MPVMNLNYFKIPHYEERIRLSLSYNLFALLNNLHVNEEAMIPSTIATLEIYSSII
jgi:hypothetical protein